MKHKSSKRILGNNLSKANAPGWNPYAWRWYPANRQHGSRSIRNRLTADDCPLSLPFPRIIKPMIYALLLIVIALQIVNHRRITTVNETIQAILDDVAATKGIVALTADGVTALQASVDHLQELVAAGNPDLSAIKTAVGELKTQTQALHDGLGAVESDASGNSGGTPPGG